MSHAQPTANKQKVEKKHIHMHKSLSLYINFFLIFIFQLCTKSFSTFTNYIINNKRYINDMHCLYIDESYSHIYDNSLYISVSDHLTTLLIDVRLILRNYQFYEKIKLAM